MSWDASGGSFADSSCKIGSPDIYLIAKNPREGVTGMISKQVGSRSNDKSALNILEFLHLIEQLLQRCLRHLQLMLQILEEVIMCLMVLIDQLIMLMHKIHQSI